MPRKCAAQAAGSIRGGSLYKTIAVIIGRFSSAARPLAAGLSLCPSLHLTGLSWTSTRPNGGQLCDGWPGLARVLTGAKRAVLAGFNQRLPSRHRDPLHARGFAGTAGSRAWAAARSAPGPSWSRHGTPGPGRRSRDPWTDRLAPPVGELVGEGPVADGQVGDPLLHLPWLVQGQGELIALRSGGGCGFGGPQRQEVLAGVAAA